MVLTSDSGYMTTTEQDVLATADRLFYASGIAGVGMDDVRDASGVSLRRLYSCYPSKRDLVTAWLQDRHRRWMDWFAEAVNQRISAGSDPLAAPFDVIEEWAASPDFRGCAFINAFAETTEINDEQRVIVAGHKRALIDYLKGLFDERRPDAPAWLPGALGVLIDGAIVQSTVLGSSTPIADARLAASRLLERAS
ncbi:MAG: TetR/AcrR family transcriptional regulator [Chloroflexota bacterium]